MNQTRNQIEGPAANLDPAVGKHDFEAHHQLAGIAVAQDAGPAGIGRDIAADLAAAFGPQAQRKQASRRVGRLLGGLQDHPGLDGHGEVRRVDFPEAVHPLQADQDLVAGGDRHDRTGAVIRQNKVSQIHRHASLGDGIDAV